MTNHELIGQISGLHQMMIQLVQNIPEADAYHNYRPGLAPLAWYLGRSAYIETWWLREQVQQDDDITSRVREIFSFTGDAPTAAQWQHLPPLDHLLNWVLELQDENIMRLANPRILQPHPLLEQDRLHWNILQEHACIYEQMLMVLTQRRIQIHHDHRVGRPLTPLEPSIDMGGVAQGHYRIGAMDDPAAYDNETPPMVVQLSNFRINRFPVTNGAWLKFIQDGGYERPDLWEPAGWEQTGRQHAHPDHWRQDSAGQWYAIGINGPFDLDPEESVMGVSQHEATAYANWVAGLGGPLSGAVLQHEYQWEVAARTRTISGYGRVWEWCSNRFQPYTGYQAPEFTEARTRTFDDRHYTLRGASLHTQRALRRPTYRNRALPAARHLFSGVRLVFPPLG